MANLAGSISQDGGTRRQFLGGLGSGCAAIALQSLLEREGKGRPNERSAPHGMPHHRPRAKNVIWMFMNGGVSHVESFDPKPNLNKYAGKTIAETPFADVQDPKKLALERLVVPDANGNQRNRLYPLQIGFRQHGASGIAVSDWFPHIASQVDKLAIIRSMWTTDSNHGAQTQFHSGRHQNDGDFPTLGAWVHYGLGSLNDNLPQFVSMGSRVYWNLRDGHYLGPAHDAVPIRIDPQNPLDFGQATAVRGRSQQVGVELIQTLNRYRAAEHPGDSHLAARIAAYDLAFRMQKSVPDVVDFSQETKQTQAMYGLDQPHCQEFGRQLLAARRMVERGVRFVQIQHGAEGAGRWDAHGALKQNHSTQSLAVDQPIAALLIDLEQRGLLDETLVIFATEFGRTPGTQGTDGRDHHIFGFSVWMAGGGLRRGVVHGATDEIGFHAVENRHYVTDVHATVLQLLGLDSRRLELPDRKRLEIDHGTPIAEIIA